MAPNSEDDYSITVQNRDSWTSDTGDNIKEPQRPPVYNPEDYALSLKKWGRKANSGMQLPLYASQSTDSIERISAELTKSLQNKRQSSPSTKSSSSSKNSDDKHSKKDKETTLKLEKKDSKNKENILSKDKMSKDFRNPILTLSQAGEMSLRQFSSVTELLGKLKIDLRLAFPSFVQEFVGDPVDGVTLLLELLRAVQLSQASQQQRCPPQVLRRALLDEHSCLVCLKHCLRCPDASRRLASSPAGLFTLAVCIMSNVTKSRILALELLTKACEPPAKGHGPVSEALSTLRLRFGEPVRFRFLVGMLNSAGAVELLTAGMKFINVFLETAKNVKQRVYIQAELEQAGFDSRILRKTLPSNSENVKTELDRWDKNYFDVETLQSKVTEVDSLRNKVQLLEKKIQILQEEKGVLLSLEQCLKERCSELEEEVKTTASNVSKSGVLKTQQSEYIIKKNNEKGESTPAEDEGISSSEQELSQDEDYGKGIATFLGSNKPFEPIIKNMNENNKNNNPKLIENVDLNPNIDGPIYKTPRRTKIKVMKETNVDDGNEVIAKHEEEEEEATIDEVIEELRNIVNDAETEEYANDNKRINSNTITKIPRAFMRKPETDKTNLPVFEEPEIVPTRLLPQPPRRARSLVHIFLPGREYDDLDPGKNEFFDEDTESDSSDSLLTATREKRHTHKSCSHRQLDVTESLNSCSSVNTRTLFIQQHDEYEMNIKLGYEERNIDEEEIKRSHLKDPAYRTAFLQQHEKAKSMGYEKVYESKDKKMNDRPPVEERLVDGLSGKVDRSLPGPYEETTSFQGIKSCINSNVTSQNPFVRRTQRFVPIPVKRSQTFHIGVPEVNRAAKRTDIKPKPKMGVSGLDLQRNLETKARGEYSKYQNIDYKKKNVDKKSESDRYQKKASKSAQTKNAEKTAKEKSQRSLFRRGSFDGLFFVVDSNKKESSKKSKKSSEYKSKSNSNLSEDKRSTPDSEKKSRSKSLERMDEGLDSLVDIVISPEQGKKQKASKSEWNLEVSKNIGPRTRRSLAESSLFTQSHINNLNKEPYKIPQPAQRTSLTRNNSSSAPLHLPVEIKISPAKSTPQLNNLGLSLPKSDDGLPVSSQTKRYPPDGSSSPMNFLGSSSNESFNLYDPAKRKNTGSSKSKEDSVIYAIPVKQSKLQKFFGNPKFESSTGSPDTGSNQKYFESNYACAMIGNEKDSKLPSPRSIANNTTQIVKNLISNSNQQKVNGNVMKVPDGKDQSKLHYFLTTYQLQPPKTNISPKNSVDPPSPTSLNSFNNAFMIKRGHMNAGLYSGVRDETGQNPNYKKIPSNEPVSLPPSSMPYSNLHGTNKVTDSPSGLY